MMSRANTIGGTDAAARNIISGNAANGVGIGGGGNTPQQPDQNVIEGNYIGTDVTGMVALGNRFDGVVISVLGERQHRRRRDRRGPERHFR